MTSPFPQLLRRSKFATHDPLITRVYTSTPSSIHHHGDWGMKYPIHRAKGPKHISVNQFDTGTILGSDWRSAEKEARFMENWGRAGRWTDAELANKRSRKNLMSGMPRIEDKYADRDYESEEQMLEEQERRQGEKLFMPDVNTMSGKEFERYLETIRRDGGNYLAQKVASLKESRGKKAIELESDATLVGIASRGQSSKSDSAHFQATMTHAETTKEGSTKLQSTSHKMFGLTYAPPSTSSSVVTGHVMNRKDESRGQSRYPKHNAADDANRSWVVSVGGLTGTLPNAISTRDAHTVKPIDYTRSDKKQGQGSFELRKAHLISPATVKKLQQSNQSARWAGRYLGVSGAKQPSPLDTFTFDIELAEDRANSTTVLPGSKEWVGRDAAKTTGYAGSDRLGLGLELGGPRKERNTREALSYLSAMEGRLQDKKAQREADREIKEVNNNVATALVARLRQKQSGEGQL